VRFLKGQYPELTDRLYDSDELDELMEENEK